MSTDELQRIGRGDNNNPARKLDTKKKVYAFLFVLLDFIEPLLNEVVKKEENLYRYVLFELALFIIKCAKILLSQYFLLVTLVTLLHFILSNNYANNLLRQLRNIFN